MPKKPARLLILFALLMAIVGGDHIYRYWRPDLTIQTDHYTIYSTATSEQTKQIGDVVELLYKCYRDTFTDLANVHNDHKKLKIKLFKDRKEFRRCNRVGWAEAFYKKPYCNAYYSADNSNPYHWMLHEAVHQLNAELAGLKIPKWADEGLAEYFSTSRIQNNKLMLGKIDANTYPIWWLWEFKFTGDIDADIKEKRIIPLRDIVTGKHGPDIDKYFNLYYVHWWSLSHFLFHYQDGKYRDAYLAVIKEKGTFRSFEKHIGPIDQIQSQWYQYLIKQQKNLTTGRFLPIAPSKQNHPDPNS